MERTIKTVFGALETHPTQISEIGAISYFVSDKTGEHRVYYAILACENSDNGALWATDVLTDEIHQFTDGPVFYVIDDAPLVTGVNPLGVTR